MYISQMNVRNESGVVRAEARIAWEETDRTPLTLFVETYSQFHEALWADPNAFLIGCVLPAWQSGEQRVKVEGTLCPVLCQNIRATLGLLKSWYPEQFGPIPTIEPSQGFQVYQPFQRQAISLLSCGIDSLATLRWNRLNVPLDHPTSVKGVLMIAFDDHPEPSADELSRQTKGRVGAASKIAANAGVQLLPVRTNIWWLVNDGYFYNEKWHGAVLSSTACFFSRGFDKAYIASSFDQGNLHPWGSHPLLDSYYSSAHFLIEHNGLAMSRLEKTALVADWPVALQNIRVCQNDNSGETNCGTCEKCIRTMTTLVALGKLSGCRSFPVDDVSPELLFTVQKYHMISNQFEAAWYRELVPVLAEHGRQDLAIVIKEFNIAHAES